MHSGFPHRQCLRPQYGPARQPSCWDTPRARAPMGSLTYEVSESTYYSNHVWDFDDYEESASIYYRNYDCDSDGYDEDFDVGYSRQPYHQPHSMLPQHPPYFTRDSYVQTQSSDPYSHRRTTHSNGQPRHKDRPLLPRSTSRCRPTTNLRQAAACLEQPAAEQQQPLLQRPPSCRHPSSGTIDGETCFMDHEIDYLSDNEKGVGHGSITATAALPAPPHAADSRCFSHLHLHHDPYNSSPLAVAALLPPQAAISPPCSPDRINTVVHRRGKSSTLKGEIESILSNKGILGRTALGNQPMITGVDCLIDRNMEQEKVILKDSRFTLNHVPTQSENIVQVLLQLNTKDTSIGFSYVMAETRDQFAIKYVYIGHAIVGYWGAKQQSRAFDPGGDASPKLMFAMLFIVSWFPP